MALFSFNPNEVEVQDDFTPIPAGEYLAQIVDSEIKPTRAEDGQYINFRFKILDERFANRVVFDMAMIESTRKDEKMETALRVAREKIAKICAAVGINRQINHTEELHDIPMLIKLAVKSDPQHGDKNEIKNYRAAKGGGISAQAGPSAGAKSGAGAPSKNPAPWERPAQGAA